MIAPVVVEEVVAVTFHAPQGLMVALVTLSTQFSQASVDDVVVEADQSRQIVQQPVDV